jgi:23S rRNA (uracil1939-C5)-methyltransferase
MRRRTVRYGGPRKSASKNTSSLPESIQVESLSLEGRGVARIDGKALFIRGALPGEVVTATMTKAGKRFDEAIVSDIEVPSTNRISPICAFANECGGCDLQHLDPDRAVEMKRDQILSTLKRQSDIEPKITDTPITSKEKLNYRRSARVGINQRENGELIIGFRRSESSKLIDIPSCPVLTDRCNRFLAALRHCLDGLDKLKTLTHISMSDGDNLLAIEIRAKKRPSDEIMHALTSVAKAETINLRVSFNDQLITLHDIEEPEFSNRQRNIRYQFDTNDFIQVNAAVNEDLVECAIDWLNPQKEDRLLDLFSGLGNFSLPFAKLAKEVVAVEGVSAMVERSQANAALNAIDNLSSFKSDLSNIDEETFWLKRQYDLILLDPPRSGAADLIPHLQNLGARAILYIACDPMSLVRDSKTLSDIGYSMTRFTVADMFPQTHHIESIALFEPKP